MNFRPKKSPIGSALFEMMTSMGRAQVRVLQNGGTISDANRAARIAAARHKPLVIDSIKRPSKK